MTAKVIEWGGLTRLDVPADRVIRKALDAGMEAVVICGFDAEGNEYFASSLADGGDVLWHLERAKLKLLQVPDRD